MRKLLFTALFSAIGLFAMAQAMPDQVRKVTGKYACTTCHAPDTRLVGPSWKELAQKGYSPKKMGQLIKKPKPENWPGYPPMAPITTISDAEVKVVAEWLATMK